MKYRELQAKVKAAGLNAKGSKAELEARYAAYDKVPARTPESMMNKVFYVYTGDPNAPGYDPTWSQMHGYMFKLNGAAVPVAPEVAAKLASHSHFTEKK